MGDDLVCVLPASSSKRSLNFEAVGIHHGTLAPVRLNRLTIRATDPWSQDILTCEP
jgi:hypothetical protein